MTKCTIIRDLLSMYVSGHLSDDSRALVDEHIETCAECQRKITELQHRVTAALNENDEKGISTFKAVKKKMTRKNLIIGVIASLLTLVLVVFCFQIIPHWETRIQYEEGMFIIEKRTAEVSIPDFELWVSGISLDISRIGGSAFVCDISRVIERDGERINVLYFYLTETPSSRRRSDKAASDYNILGVRGDVLLEDYGYGRTDNPSLPKTIINGSLHTEVYYLVKPQTGGQFRAFNEMTDAQFYEKREEGTLIWSGTLNAHIEKQIALYKTENAWLSLNEGNEYALSGPAEISYMPSGTYTVEGGVMKLFIGEEEMFSFLLVGDTLIFESGEWLENWVEPGTVFTLAESK